MTHPSERSLEPARREWKRRNRSGNRIEVTGDSREGVSPTLSAPALVPIRYTEGQGGPQKYSKCFIGFQGSSFDYEVSWLSTVP